VIIVSFVHARYINLILQ